MLEACDDPDFEYWPLILIPLFLGLVYFQSASLLIQKFRSTSTAFSLASPRDLTEYWQDLFEPESIRLVADLGTSGTQILVSIVFFGNWLGCRKEARLAFCILGVGCWAVYLIAELVRKLRHICKANCKVGAQHQTQDSRGHSSLADFWQTFWLKYGLPAIWQATLIVFGSTFVSMWFYSSCIFGEFDGICTFTDRPKYALVILCGINIMLVWFRLIFFARGIQSLARPVRVLFRMIRDVFPFIILVLIIMFGFVFALFFVGHVVTGDNDDDEKGVMGRFGTFRTALLYSFFYGWFGELISVEQLVDPPTYQSVATYLFCVICLFVFIVHIILMNLLIAMMSDELSKTSKDVDRELLMVRAELVIDTFEQWIPSISSAHGRGYMSFYDCMRKFTPSFILAYLRQKLFDPARQNIIGNADMSMKYVHPIRERTMTEIQRRYREGDLYPKWVFVLKERDENRAGETTVSKENAKWDYLVDTLTSMQDQITVLEARMVKSLEMLSQQREETVKQASARLLRGPGQSRSELDRHSDGATI